MPDEPTIRLGAIATFEMGQSPPSSVVVDGYRGVPFLQGCAEFGQQYARPHCSCLRPPKVCKKGDVLISVRAPVGTINKADREYCIGRGLAAVWLPEDYPENYGWHLLGYWAPGLRRVSHGTTFEAVGRNDLENLEIVDIRPEDRAGLVAVLDTADEAIAKTEALIAKLKSIKQGLLHDLLTRGLDDNGELRDPDTNEAQFNKTPLGVRPKEWQVRPLGQVLLEIGGRLQTGPFGSQLHAHEYQPDGVPVIMPENIQDGRIELQSIARVSEAKATAMARHRISAGDIVFARRGDLSRAAATSEREQGWLCGTGCFLLRLPSGTVNPFWLAEVYRSVYVQRQVEARSVGSTMLSLNNTVMESLLIGWPTKAEQDAIMARLDEWSQRIAGESAYLSKLKGIKKALMQDLLTGRVRVPGDKAPTFATG